MIYLLNTLFWWRLNISFTYEFRPTVVMIACVSCVRITYGSCKAHFYLLSPFIFSILPYISYCLLKRLSSWAICCSTKHKLAPSTWVLRIWAHKKYSAKQSILSKIILFFVRTPCSFYWWRLTQWLNLANSLLVTFNIGWGCVCWYTITM